MFEDVKSYENIDAKENSIKKLLQIIDNLEFGSVSITIQDSKIVQIEKNEKIRIK